MRKGIITFMSLLTLGLAAWMVADHFPDKTYQTYERGRYWAEIIRHWKDLRPVELPTYSEAQHTTLFITKSHAAVSEYDDPEGYAVISAYFAKWDGSVAIFDRAIEISGTVSPCPTTAFDDDVRQALADLQRANLERWRFGPRFSGRVSIVSKQMKTQIEIEPEYWHRIRSDLVTQASVVGFDAKRSTAVFFSGWSYVAAWKQNGKWQKFVRLSLLCPDPPPPHRGRTLIM